MYAGAFQCGKVGRVSEKAKKVKISGKAMQSTSRSADFPILIFPLNAATIDMMAKTKITGLL